MYENSETIVFEVAVMVKSISANLINLISAVLFVLRVDNNSAVCRA